MQRTHSEPHRLDPGLQEPIFVPRPGGEAEDDGWVLTMVYNSGSDRTELAILDAQQLSEGPVARICLPHHIPYGISPSSSSRECRCCQRLQR